MRLVVQASQQLGMTFFAQCPPESILDLSIPQAVDLGLSIGLEKSIKQEKYCLLYLKMLGLVDHVYDSSFAKEEPNHTEVRATGGEGLSVTLS